VPTGARVLLYHIPQVTGIAIGNDLITALLREFSDRLLGVKDSQGDRAHTLDWCRRFRSLNVFVGHDQLLADALGVGAAGAILASANVFAPLARALLDAHSRGEDTTDRQTRLDAVRTLMDTVSAPPAYKALLAELYELPARGRPWPVRLPLVPLSAGARTALTAAAQELMTIPPHD
jgi:4-hydroxy-tetrahydrodipicolinate synthase